MAAVEKNRIKRLALAGCFSAVFQAYNEKFPAKPFNPLLGETFEMIIPGKFKFIAEQVSHHPPIAALYTAGESGYVINS